jgi:hypothetical protein
MGVAVIDREIRGTSISVSISGGDTREGGAEFWECDVPLPRGIRNRGMVWRKHIFGLVRGIRIGGVI